MKETIRKFVLALAAVTVSCAPMLANNGAPKPLAERVRHELAMLPYFSIFDDVSFRVDGTTVYLSGDVRQPVLKSDAESAVKHTEGVTQVVDNIQVLPLSPFDNRIRMAEFQAVFGYSDLYRYAMGTSPSVRIIVANGHVRLLGFVANQGDKKMAGIRANGVPGVFAVENDLQVAN
jgi:hyperosmotically inducible protein